MNDERAAEAIEHLQAAALELIAAARAALDVAEELVREPAAAATIVAAATSLGRSVLGGSSPAGSSHESANGETRVRRIHVS